MARTQEEIEQEINEEASRHASLSALQGNTSRVSVWGYAKQVMAFAVHTLERMFDKHKEEVSRLVQAQQVGTEGWYAAQALRYQHGHSVTLVDYRPGYAIVDPPTRIIKHVAVEEGTSSSLGTVFVKVVKVVSDVLSPLSADELRAFQSYMDAITFAGIKVQASSAAAIPVQVQGQVQVDAQYIDTVTGQRVGKSHKPVEDALSSHLRRLPFNGIVRASALEDAVQAVEGVIDVHFSSLQYRAPSIRGFTASFKPSSGHAILDNQSAFTYTTEVLS